MSPASAWGQVVAVVRPHMKFCLNSARVTVGLVATAAISASDAMTEKSARLTRSQNCEKEVASDTTPEARHTERPRLSRSSKAMQPSAPPTVPPPLRANSAGSVILKSMMSWPVKRTTQPKKSPRGQTPALHVGLRLSCSETTDAAT